MARTGGGPTAVLKVAEPAVGAVKAGRCSQIRGGRAADKPVGGRRHLAGGADKPAGNGRSRPG